MEGKVSDGAREWKDAGRAEEGRGATSVAPAFGLAGFQELGVSCGLVISN